MEQNTYNYKGLGRAAKIAYEQALAIGCDHRDAKLLAASMKSQKAILRLLETEPDNVRAKVDLAYQREFARLLASQEDDPWYCRAAAGVKAAELAMELGIPINWHLAIRNAAAIAEADCDGSDEEAFAAAEAAKDAWRARFQKQEA